MKYKIAEAISCFVAIVGLALIGYGIVLFRGSKLV